MHLKFLCLGLLLLANAASAQDVAPGDAWQVVLLKPRGCGACTLLEESLKRKGYLQQVALNDGAGHEVVATIQRRSSSELTAAEWQEVTALPYVDAELWRQSARENSPQVLLRNQGRIVAAGDIADSASLRGAEFPVEISSPAQNASVGLVRAARQAWYQDFFLRNWNLDYFYRLALRPELGSEASFANWLARQRGRPAPPLAPANVLLMSTASGASDNEIFNAMRIEEIRGVLTGELSVSPAQLQVYYGAGNRPGANAVEVRQGRIAFTRREIDGAEPFTLPNLAQAFQRIRADSARRNLLVFVGHGGPDGAGLWASPALLSPANLHELHAFGGGDDVLVSGNCFGGVMAKSMSCGFFGARPDVIATGCQADAAEVAQSKDYLHVFFASLSAAERAKADIDRDGAISFDEAHWRASLIGDQRNVTYSSADAMAEDYFAAHPEQLPATIRVAELRELARGAPVVEAGAAARLTEGLAPDTVIMLTDIAGQASRWKGPGEGVRPMLAQLSKRLLYTQRHAGDSAELKRIEACGNQSIAGFLRR